MNAWSLAYSCVAFWQFSYMPAGGRQTTTLSVCKSDSNPPPSRPSFDFTSGCKLQQSFHALILLCTLYQAEINRTIQIIPSWTETEPKSVARRQQGAPGLVRPKISHSSLFCSPTLVRLKTTTQLRTGSTKTRKRTIPAMTQAKKHALQYQAQG